MAQAHSVSPVENEGLSNFESQFRIASYKGQVHLLIDQERNPIRFQLRRSSNRKRRSADLETLAALINSPVVRTYR